MTDYRLKGVVKRVEKELEHVTIHHEAIPGFMDAMTMRFAYKDKSVLELAPARRPGGRDAAGRAGKTASSVDYELLDLTVTKPAPPANGPRYLQENRSACVSSPQRLEIGEPVPDFAMTSQDGKAVKLSDLRGNVVVLTFIYTRCPLPDFCPLMDKKFSELAQRLGAFPERARQDPPDFALVRPRARYTRCLAQACPGSRGYAAPLVICGCLPRRAGQDRCPAGALLPARRQRDRPQPLHGDHRSAGETGPPGNRDSTQQMGDCRPVEDHLFTASRRRKRETGMATS